MQARQFLIPFAVIAALAAGHAVAQETRPGAATKTVVTQAAEPATPNASVLLTRQSQRIEMLETDLRDMRGLVETDLRNLKMQITQISNNATSGETATTAEIRDLRDQVERLADAVAMASRRMERTLEITSDMEFRLLRMEKRLQTLMNLGGDELARAAVEDDTIPAGDSPEVSMKKDADTGEVTWQMSATKLNEQLSTADETAPQATDLANLATAPAGADAAQPAPAQPETVSPALSETPVVTPPKPEVLPDASPEEQYNFALQRAMQNDLETAEAAFAEFRTFNAGHAREADSLFWLGRIQFLRGQFEQAALTFSEFSRAYPEDARLNDTTIWVAESVSRFAPPEQACDIYRQLPSVVPEPSERLTERLAALSEAANCGG
ncbi:MAG: tetratricopeptide repeat protein [Pseudomonadota bacterium]|nr:tetratricopeptide repeat protein [Pseudomonadota bacterium]